MVTSLKLLSILCILTFVFIEKSLAKQRVLLYSKTAGFRHASIPNAIKAFEKLGKENDIYMYNTEDETKFEDWEWVNKWDAMVFISVSGTIFNDKGTVNMMKYIENGGGFMGIHEACDAMYKSPWYGRLVGAYFDYHPYLQSFTLDVESHDHPSTSFLGKTWKVYDEVYTFNSDPRDLEKHVVLTANPKSYKDPTGPGIKTLQKQEGKHPIAWYKEGGLLDEPDKHIGGGIMNTVTTPKNQRGNGGNGRAFYTALGHTKSCWKKKDMIEHVWGGLSWVLDSNSIKSNDDSLPSSAPGSKFIAKQNSTSTSNSTSSTPNTASTNSTNQNPLSPTGSIRASSAHTQTIITSFTLVVMILGSITVLIL